MKRIILTIAAVLTLMSCTPEEEVRLINGTEQRLVGEWLIHQRSTMTNEWDCSQENTETINMYEDNTISISLYKPDEVGGCLNYTIESEFYINEDVEITGDVLSQYERFQIVIQGELCVLAFLTENDLYILQGDSLKLNYELERIN